MKVTRGDVVLLDHPFSTGVGSKVRPVVVVQCDRDNGRLLNTIVAMITKTIHRADRESTQHLIDIAIPAEKLSELRVTSAVSCSNLSTVHESLIRKGIGHLTSEAMQDVDRCLKAALGIP